MGPLQVFLGGRHTHSLARFARIPANPENLAEREGGGGGTRALFFCPRARNHMFPVPG